MILATYNVDNMFKRAKAMNMDTWKQGEKYLEDFTKLNQLIQEPVYTPKIKTDILNIMKSNRGLLTNNESDCIILQKIRGDFLYHPKNKPVEIVASGRSSWIGWFDLKTEPVSEKSTDNLATVIGLVKADVLCVIEVEDRPLLVRFNNEIFPRVQTPLYQHIRLMDGNDIRGIDVGIMTKQGYGITRILSHVDDADATGIIFSRDCAEYEIKTPKRNKLLLLINHFKSKGFGKPSESDAKRLRQATRVREIYDAYINSGFEYIALCGDLNEIPSGSPLDPLIRQGSTLIDIMSHPKFAGDGYPGTFGEGNKDNKIDYILMSPKLAAKVITGGINRKGVWAGKDGKKFNPIPMKDKSEAASDHSALWAEWDI